MIWFGNLDAFDDGYRMAVEVKCGIEVKEFHEKFVESVCVIEVPNLLVVYVSEECAVDVVFGYTAIFFTWGK